MSPGHHVAAQRLLKELDELDADFKSYHFSIIDLLDTEPLDAEQSALDEHDDKVSILATRIQQLVVRSSDDSSATTTTDSSPHRHLTKLLSCVERDLRSIGSAIDSITPDREIDVCLLKQYESQLSGIKADLTSVSHEVSRLDDDGGLSEQESSLCKVHFDVCLRI